MNPRAQPRSTLEMVRLAIPAFLALVPLFWLRHEFHRLFWFGDEWQLLDEIQRMGLVKWSWQVFAENFVPVFKLLWAGGAYLFHGDYFAMVVLMWLTHTLNTFWFGRLLRAYQLDWIVVGVSQLVFALSPINIETLGWCVQWSAVLAMAFMLVALDWQARRKSHLEPIRWNNQGWLFVFSAASAFSFSRGVLTGAMIALNSVWPLPRPWHDRLGRRLLTVTAGLLPAVFAAAMIYLMATGNHHHLSGHYGEVANFGLWYFFLNPAYHLFDVDSFGYHTTWLLGLLKIALIIWTLRRCPVHQRTLFVLLLAFDLSNSVLLGIGRYHTGLEASCGSRYQYGSLVSTLPFMGFWLSYWLHRLPHSLHLLVGASVLALVAIWTPRHWGTEIHWFALSRGAETRKLMDPAANLAPMGAVPGIPFMSTDRARQLITEFDLH